MSEGRRELPVAILVNGTSYRLVVPSRYTLAELLRETLDLTGTKLGCNRAECGACTVLIDGLPVFSCTTLAAEANGRRVETVEGLSRDTRMRRLQTAFVKEDALQCGFCTPGILMSLKALLDRKARPTESEVNHAIAGNYCRCGAYPNIRQAAMKALLPTEDTP